MKRIIYLVLLFAIPFSSNADTGRRMLEGRWINPQEGRTIKIKVNRDEIRIKNLTNRGWTSFYPIRAGLFEDCEGSTIKIRNVHDLEYRSAFGRYRERFVKRGHSHHNHRCNSSCSLDNNLFTYRSDGENYFLRNGSRSGDRDRRNNKRNRRKNSFDQWQGDEHNYYGDYNNNRNYGGYSTLSGKYYVREIDEYIDISKTRDGLRARRQGKDWVTYNQNRYRKNEYADNRGNTYLVGQDGNLRWKNKKKGVSLNLSRP